MAKYVCAVRDRAIDAFMNPFVVPSVGMAIRSFGDEINRPDGPMGQHPEDYDLYVLAEFDESNGRFSANEPRRVADGMSTRKAPGGIGGAAPDVGR